MCRVFCSDLNDSFHCLRQPWSPLDGQSIFQQCVFRLWHLYFQWPGMLEIGRWTCNIFGLLGPHALWRSWPVTLNAEQSCETARSTSIFMTINIFSLFCFCFESLLFVCCFMSCLQWTVLYWIGLNCNAESIWWHPHTLWYGIMNTHQWFALEIAEEGASIMYKFSALFFVTVKSMPGGNENVKINATK